MPAYTSGRSNPPVSTYVPGGYSSPTESDFSTESYDGPDNVRDWDEKRVSSWLKSIKADQYIDLFLEHNITGENLMDIDQSVLKEMGVKKIGDRVRIGSQAKVFRHQEYRRKRNSNRDSFALLDRATSPMTNSPRKMTRSTAPVDKRAEYGPLYDSYRRAASPTHLDSGRTSTLPIRPNVFDPSSRDTYLTQPGSGGSIVRSGGDTPQTARIGQFSKSPTMPDLTTQPTKLGGALPSDKAVVRVIYDNAQSSIVNVDGCKTQDDIILRALKKGMLKETHVKSYTFYILEGTEAKPSNCKRLNEQELLRVSNDRSRPERERLMFRKIHAGEPEGAQLNAAATLAVQQLAQQGFPDNAARSMLKIQKLTGEPLPSISYPMSPASAAEREKHLVSTAQDLERSETTILPAPRTRPPRMKAFPSGRPPSELVVADPDTYFPDAEKDQIQRTVRMSIRRSQRLSRATSRLSVASNFSVASSMKDAPPVPALPSISDQWWNGTNVPATVNRLSIVGKYKSRPVSTYRESMASSILDPLDEESSPTSQSSEPNRKSYVSFASESQPDSSGHVSITDPDGKTVQSYFDDAASTTMTENSGGSMNEQLTQAIDEDGEEPDEELTEFLRGDSWDNVKYIRGKLIGQGSYGSVYLALHAVTGELMAVKQVELPSTAGTAIDARKNTMVEALKREIALLRDLKHPYIVQYLGSSSDDNNLNIFLEYIPGGSIAKMLVDYGSLNEGLVAKFVRQILIGLSYLHSKDIIHRDIKGANILVDNHGSVKISDFGISKRVQDSKALISEGAVPGARGRGGMPNNRVSLQGSIFWMAPEVVKQTANTRKADIWSLGCLIVEMLTGSHPHPNCTQLQAIFKIGGKGTNNDPTPDIPAEVSREAREFLQATFRVDHDERPEAEELLEFDFLKMKGL